MPAPPSLTPPPNFRTATREVDIWRREAALALDVSPEAGLSLLTGDEIRGVTRCVRLNNYWCIKRAGWAGEIAADSEGHVAFSSAREGAAVAALLLRRYYVDFNLKTARQIVSRWAPMQCGATLMARGGTSRPRLASATLPGGLATRGLGNTTRARWLASHTIGGLSRPSAATIAARKFARNRPPPPPPAPLPSESVRQARLADMGVTLTPTRPAPVVPAAKPAPIRVAAANLTRRSVVRDVTMPLMATPSIMVGFGASSTPGKPGARLAMLPYAGIAMGPAPGGVSLGGLPPLTSCASDAARLANYAAKTSAGVVANADTDLALYDAEGKPTANLAMVMANMAAVEIGPLRVSEALVLAGVAAVVARTR